MNESNCYIDYPCLSKLQASEMAKDLQKRGLSYSAISLKLKLEGYRTRTGKQLAERTVQTMIREAYESQNGALTRKIRSDAK